MEKKGEKCNVCYLNALSFETPVSVAQWQSLKPEMIYYLFDQAHTDPVFGDFKLLFTFLEFLPSKWVMVQLNGQCQR